MPRRSPNDTGFSTRTTAERLRPPDDVTGPEKAEFLAIVTAMPASHFQQGDLPLLSAFARAVVQERVASSELAAAGYVDGDRPSAWLQVWQASMRAVTTLSRALRLSPLARRETGTPTNEESVSYYDRMALEAASREPDDPN